MIGEDNTSAVADVSVTQADNVICLQYLCIAI